MTYDVRKSNSPVPCKTARHKFFNPITELHQLNEAVTRFASWASEKLRKQSSIAGEILVFIRTSPFRKDGQYSRSTMLPFRMPTADTTQIVASTLAGLNAIYRNGFNIAKVGAMLMELQSEAVQQGELDLNVDGESDAAHERGRR